MLSDNKLNSLIQDVVSTLEFYGVKVTGVEVGGKPHFSVSVSSKLRKKSLDETLNLTYWILWSLIYGKYKEKDKRSISLDYIEVE